MANQKIGIIFDWDNTVFPTTFLKNLKKRAGNVNIVSVHQLDAKV